MSALQIIVTIIYILVCAALAVVVLMQDGKSSGLSGAISGGSGDSYWSKNKGRSTEGTLTRVTIILSVLFVAISILLNVLQ